MFPVDRYEVRLHSLPTGICLNLKHSQMSVVGIDNKQKSEKLSNVITALLCETKAAQMSQNGH
jgi:hypothetical protein